MIVRYCCPVGCSLAMGMPQCEPRANWHVPSRLQPYELTEPNGKFARAREFDQRQAMNVWMVLHLSQRLGRRLAVEVEHADGLAAGALAADRHAGNVDVVPAENGADVADQSRHVAVREDQHRAVEIGIEPERADL